MDAYEAPRLAEAMRRDFLARHESFVSGTVFSDPAGAKLGLLRDAEAASFEVTLFFIGLESPVRSVARVMNRVREGGHEVPDDKIAARYPRTMENLAKALREVERVLIYDNSDADRPHRLLGVSERGREAWRTAKPIPAWARRFLPAVPVGAG